MCTLTRYYDRVYFHFRHLEFEPLGSAVAPNPTSFKSAVLGQKVHVLHWMDKIIYEAASTRSNTARKYWSPTEFFVIRKIFWMYLYRNCLRRYTKCVAFLELNGIEKKLSSLCQILAGNFLLLNGRAISRIQAKCKIQQALLRNEGLAWVFAVHATGVQEMYKR